MSAIQNQSAANANQQSSPEQSPVIERSKTGEAGENAQKDQGYATRWLDPLVVLNLALFAAVLIQAGIYWKQLREMRRTIAILTRQADAQEKQTGTMQGQLTIMRDSLTHNQESFERSWQLGNAQGLAMTEQLIVMRDQATISRGQMNTAIDAVKASERSAKAAEDGVNAMRENFYTAERAYMGILKLDIGERLIPNAMPTLKITWQNGGKTPAWNFRCLVDLKIDPDPPPGAISFADDDYSDIRGSFWPSGKVETMPYETGVNITQDIIDQLWRGETKLWVIIRGIYIDISTEANGFGTRALWMQDLLHPGQGYFIEAFEYVEYLSEREKAEKEKAERQKAKQE